jgi:methionine biosynthesis protein MetW
MSVIERIVEYIAEIELLENKRTALSLLEWNPASVMLDCGCNNGESTLEVAKRIGTKNIYGIDVLKENVIAARARGIEVYQHDLNERLPFSDETFDVVHASRVIEHLSNTDLFIRELYRVLKFGGYVVMSTPNLSSIHHILYLIFGKQPAQAAVSDEVVVGGWKAAYPSRSNSPSHRRLFTFGALTGLCEYHGFRVEKSKGAGFYPFPSFISRVLTMIVKHYSSGINIKLRKSIPNTTES